jgi:hypothetical protein
MTRIVEIADLKAFAITRVNFNDLTATFELPYAKARRTQTILSRVTLTFFPYRDQCTLQIGSNVWWGEKGGFQAAQDQVPEEEQKLYATHFRVLESLILTYVDLLGELDAAVVQAHNRVVIRYGQSFLPKSKAKAKSVVGPD